MKKIILSILVTFICFTTYSQSKDTFVLESIPHYDEFGNLYQVTKYYNHIPTRQDSLNFNIEVQKFVKHNMDSVYRRNYEYERTRKSKKSINKSKNK